MAHYEALISVYNPATNEIVRRRFSMEAPDEAELAELPDLFIRGVAHGDAGPGARAKLEWIADELPNQQS